MNDPSPVNESFAHDFEDWIEERREVDVDPTFADRLQERVRSLGPPRPVARRTALSPLSTALFAVAASLLFLIQGAALLSVLLPH